MAGGTNIEQLAAGQRQENQSACDLKVCIGNPKCVENNLPEKNKSDSHAERCEDSQRCLTLALLRRSAGRESHEYRDKSDWIDGDKDRNESDEKFLNHFDPNIYCRLWATGEHSSSTDSSQFLRYAGKHLDESAAHRFVACFFGM